MNEELSLDEVEAIIEEEPPKRVSRGKRDPFADRSITGWFGLQHTFTRNCEVELHDEEERPRNKGATVIINDVAVCRVCYLGELDKHT